MGVTVASKKTAVDTAVKAQRSAAVATTAAYLSAEFLNADFLTPVQVSERLQVSRQTLSYWRSKNTGPLSYRIGSLVRYPLPAFEAWLAAQAGESARGAVVSA